MEGQICKKCGAEVEAEDCGRPCDAYYCECGNSWVDIEGWTERQCANADNLRKRMKEEGYFNGREKPVRKDKTS